MVLVRRRNEFVNALVRALKREGVEVAGVDRLNLGQELAIQDLLAMARFVLLPQDDLNLAALLKSPLIGLREEQLFTLVQRMVSSHLACQYLITQAFAEAKAVHSSSTGGPSACFVCDIQSFLKHFASSPQ